MKKSLLTILLLLLSLSLGIAGVRAETTGMMDVDELIANYEPRPASVPSFHASAPFEPIVLHPYELMAQVAQCNSSDDIMALSSGLGLPLSADDCEYINQSRNNQAIRRYPVPKGRWKFTEAITLSYAFADLDDRSDNLTFIFAGNGETYSLIDILPAFDDTGVVTDAQHQTLWLVGETRSGEDTSIRWYNLMGRKYSLSYLVKGVMADRVDYHVKVQSLADPIVDGTLPLNGMLAVRKQVSLKDYTKTDSTEVSEILLYTQIDVYAYQPGSDVALVQSKIFEGMDLQSVSGITSEQVMNQDD